MTQPKLTLTAILTALIFASSAHGQFQDTSTRTPVRAKDVLFRISDEYKRQAQGPIEALREAKNQEDFNQALAGLAFAIDSNLGLCVTGDLNRQADTLMAAIKDFRSPLGFDKVFVVHNPKSGHPISLSLSLSPEDPLEDLFTLFVGIMSCEG